MSVCFNHRICVRKKQNSINVGWFCVVISNVKIVVFRKSTRTNVALTIFCVSRKKSFLEANLNLQNLASLKGINALNHTNVKSSKWSNFIFKSNFSWAECTLKVNQSHQQISIEITSLFWYGVPTSKILASKIGRY